jgi:hypothetical protein
MDCNSDQADAQAEKNARTPSVSTLDSAVLAPQVQEKRLDATPRSVDAEAGPRDLVSRAVKPRGGGFSSSPRCFSLGG